MLEIIRLIIALLFTGVCAYTDYKTRYIPEKAAWVLLILSILLALLLKEFQNLLIASVIFSIGFLAYLTGRIGAGDVFVITIITLLVPKTPSSIPSYFGIKTIPTPFPFIFSTFILAALIGPMLIQPIKMFIRLNKNKHKIKKYKEKLITGLLTAALFGFTLIVISQFNKLFLLLTPSITISTLILPFKEDLLKQFAIKKKISELDEDDVIATEFIKSEVLKKLGIKRKTLLKRELKKVKQKAKKQRIKTILVYDNLPPFLPYLLLAMIINLITGDFFTYFLLNS